MSKDDYGEKIKFKNIELTESAFYFFFNKYQVFQILNGIYKESNTLQD